MRDPSDPLIAAAVNPIKDLELRLAASGMLASVSSGEEGNSDSASDVIRRWEATDHSKSRWKLILYVTAVLAVILSGILHFSDAIAYQRLFSLSIFEWLELKEPAEKAMEDPRWTEEDRLLLFGDRSRPEGEQRKTLWERHPEDPVLFADYVQEHLNVKRKLPDGFREIAARIDPDNSYFIYLEASVPLLNVANKKRLKPEKAQPRVYQWIVKDQEKLLEGLSIATAAIDKPRYNSYDGELAMRRSALLRQDGRLNSVYRAVIISYNGGLIRQLGVMKAYGARASQLASERNEQGFIQLSGSAESFVRAFAISNQNSLLHEMVARTLISSFSEDFGKAADELSMTSEADRLKAMHRKIEAAESRRSWNRESYEELENRGDMLSAAYLPNLARLTREPVAIGLKDLLPGSRADHALASRGLALAAGLLAGGIAIALSSARFGSSRLVRTVGDRLESLLGWKDYLWIIGIGVIVPTVYVLGISYLTPFSCRQWSLSLTLPVLPAAHFVALMILTIISSLLAGRWRLRKRAAILGVGASSWVTRAGWYSVAAVAVFVPLIGAYVNIGFPSEPDVWWLGVFLLPAVLWLLGVAVRPLFGKLEARLTASASAKIVPPVLTCFALLMMAMAVVFDREDEYWFRNYHVIKTGQNGSPFSNYEAEISKSMRRELIEILGTSDGAK